jgi:hypothetical protein
MLATAPAMASVQTLRVQLLRRCKKVLGCITDSFIQCKNKTPHYGSAGQPRQRFIRCIDMDLARAAFW